MKVLVTGAKGQVGQELVRIGNRYGFDITGLDEEDLDITDPLAVEEAVTQKDISLLR